MVGSGGYPIYDVRGNAVQPSSSPNGGVGIFTDTNGNQISTDGNGNFTDTSGATVLTIAGTSPQTYTYKDTSGNPQKVTISYKTYTVQTAFGCTGVSESNFPSTPLVDTISYADGSAYHFTYEPTPGNSSGAVTGRLASMQTPTGGVIGYAYTGGSQGIVCADGSAAGLTRTMKADSGSAASTWKYTRIPGAGTSHTDVIDGNGNTIAYDFVVPSSTGSTTKLFYKTNRNAWNGARSGAPAYSGQICFNNANASCTTAAVSWPITQTDTYETYDGRQQDGATTTYNSYGEVTGVKTYDFGAGSVSTQNSRGAVLSSEALTYGGSTAPANFLSSDSVADASGTQASAVYYSYDQTTPATSSGVPSHTSVSGSRGNLTSISTITSSSVPLTTTMSYEDTGSLLSSVDSINGTTKFGYDATFTYNTSTTLPTPSSGVGMTASAAFDSSNTGLPWSSTDVNAASIKVASYNAMLQPLEIDAPDGGKTTLTYDGPNQSGVYSYRDSSHFTDTETLLDSYGRVSRVAVGQNVGANIWYQHDACYDANGNLSFTAYKYQGGGWGTGKVCSGAGDVYNYDVLGRVTGLVHGDGTRVFYQYTGRATKVTDENGVSRISQRDGLDRTTVVCELSSSTLQGDAPSACGADIAGTGFVTSYSYDLANHKTVVTQGVQTRVFQTDWVGRPVLTTEPERGTTTYAYSNNSTGLVTTRTRPRANQTNAGVTTATVTQYDTLSRPVSAAYNDGTPERDFHYDTGAGWGQSQSNLKGRLSQVSEAALGNWAGAIFSYDAVGRVTLAGQCFPYSCGNAGKDKYSSTIYDWHGNITSTSDPTNGNVSYTYSDANEVTGITGMVANAGSSGMLVSNVQNGPNGPTAYTLGNGLGEAVTYDGLGRLNGKWLCKGGAPGAGCPNDTQVYGMTAAWSGSRLTGSCDTAINTCRGFGYDEFNRLNSQTVTGGAVQNFTWVYDRYGNRWQQNITGGSGPQSQTQFNRGNNRDCDACYDAAGNKTSDGIHTYGYDAESNMTLVDGGQTATYSYDALNRRFRVKTAQDTVDYQFDVLGRRTVAWRESTNFGIRDSYYWGSQAIAYHALDGTSYYEQQDWLGTERVRTNSSGNTVASYTSLPFGDGFSNSSASDEVPDHFAGTERDKESYTDHAQFRQYQEALGRWMSPDPYDGSYDINNPQSLNRYSYVLNNPLTFLDPSGLDCWGDVDNSIQECIVDGGGGGGGYGCWFCNHYYGPPSPGAGGGSGGGGSAPSQPPSPAPVHLPALNRVPNKITCGTVLPNGQTVGSYVNQLSNTINNASQSTSTPYGSSASYTPGFSPLSIPGQVYSGTNFRGMFGRGAGYMANAFFGDAGNFAYAAVSANIGVPYLATELAAAGYFWTHHSPSDWVGPYGMDPSATVQVPAGYGASCKGY